MKAYVERHHQNQQQCSAQKDFPNHRRTPTAIFAARTAQA
jgi:hypothetical protein